MADDDKKVNLNLNFRARFEGLPDLGFCNISGFETAVDVIQEQEGNRNKPAVKPKSLQYSNIILRRGVQSLPVSNRAPTPLSK